MRNLTEIRLSGFGGQGVILSAIVVGIIEQDLVRVDKVPPGVRVYGVPATRLAEELGKRMVLNIVMVGFFAAVTNILQPDAIRQAVADSVPPAFQELNLKAFDKGYEYGTKHLTAEVETEDLSIDEVTTLERS
jgi:2-oxoglutarate ferredoxin oxidoreductase subunit gamma